jgi:hypothetical protein
MLDSISFSVEPVFQPPTGTTIAVSQAGNSGIRIAFPAQVGAAYSVQSTTNLYGWETVASIQPTNGMAQFSDILISNSPARFYRVKGP